MGSKTVRLRLPLKLQIEVKLEGLVSLTKGDCERVVLEDYLGFLIRPHYCWICRFDLIDILRDLKDLQKTSLSLWPSLRRVRGGHKIHSRAHLQTNTANETKCAVWPCVPRAPIIQNLKLSS